MQDHVIAADGHTYEGQAMKAWLQQHETSPVTGQQLKHLRLVSNFVIKAAIPQPGLHAGGTQHCRSLR